MTTPYTDPDTIAVIGALDPVPSGWFGTVRDDLEFLARPPGCQALRTANQSVASSSWTPVQFTAADTRDTDNFHDTSTDPQNLVIPSGLGGWYSVTFLTHWAANGSGFRGVRLQVNGNTVNPGPVYLPPVTGQETRLQLSDEVLLNAGDVLTCDAWQSSGGSLNLTAAKVTLRMTAVSP